MNDTDPNGGRSQAPLNIVTGAFGFSGGYIARRLLSCGERVRTLTNHPRAGSSIEAAPLDFGNVEGLTRKMAGAAVLYNTYWVRFAHGHVNHQTAVRNTETLLRAAERAGIRRIVHVSITNPSLDSPLPYFRGKARVEDLIRSSSLSYAILRPAVIFGEEDILINNIAWLLRKSPLFAIPGSGEYGLQPIFVDDLTDLAVEAGHGTDNLVIDAVGPEAFSYVELVKLIRCTIGSRSRVIHLPPSWVQLASWMVGLMVNDVILTKDEVRGLTANLLISKQEPAGHTSLRKWIEEHAGQIGTSYASELDRHYQPPHSGQPAGSE